MNTTKLTIAALTMAMFSTAAYAKECNAPEAPEIPDGDTASESQMTVAEAEFKHYVAQSQRYLSCVKDKQMELAANATEDEREAVEDMYDTMVEEVSYAYEEMNEAAEDFKEAADEKMAEASAATKNEREAIANLYDDLVASLKSVSKDAQAAYEDFQEETEEAE